MKTIKPKKSEFTVDLTWCRTPNDIYAEFGFAKQKAGLAMSNLEFSVILIEASGVKEWGSQLVKNFFETLEMIDAKDWCQSTKKPNIFKRFWNWITRKK